MVDSHLRTRLFGGKVIPFEELTGYPHKSGVHFANMFGIGQTLPVDSGCTYYLDCPGVPVAPSMKNDFVNAANYVEAKPKDPELALSMTFMDLNHPETIPSGIDLYDKEFPGAFRWAGAVLRDCGIPITIHSDLGSDTEQTKYLPLMEKTLRRHPQNKIEWAHMGLSKELSTMDPDQHIGIMKRLLDRYPRLTLDLSWRTSPAVSTRHWTTRRSGTSRSAGTTSGCSASTGHRRGCAKRAEPDAVGNPGPTEIRRRGLAIRADPVLGPARTPQVNGVPAARTCSEGSAILRASEAVAAS
ncbi:hypothetical protein ABZY02_14095 [Streptomyces sp. NPDC006649]|uniref:hypothetical protein n=1 Tax=Streptomyces sp. NPDC006649 TaxID=3156896 RepID=UPI0033BE3821